MSTFKERYKKALEDMRKVEEEKYNKYINGDYKKVNNRNEIRDLLIMKKGDMCVLDEKHIYIYSGHEYDWEKYKVNHNKKILLKVINPETNAYQGCYKLSPTNKKYKELKEKQNNNTPLTEEERKAVSHVSFWNSFLIFNLAILGIVILKNIFF